MKKAQTTFNNQYGYNIQKEVLVSTECYITTGRIMGHTN